MLDVALKHVCVVWIEVEVVIVLTPLKQELQALLKAVYHIEKRPSDRHESLPSKQRRPNEDALDQALIVCRMVD